MFIFLTFLLIIGSVFTSCTSQTSCESCLTSYLCDWCEDNKKCYDSTLDNENCSDWKYFKSDCPGYLAKILGAVFGAIAGVIILSICCVCLVRRAQKKKLQSYTSSNNNISLKPVTVTTPTTLQEPNYEPNYKPNYEPNFQPSYQPNYQPNYQEPNFQPNYQEPNFQQPIFNQIIKNQIFNLQIIKVLIIISNLLFK
ncbi:hypothetical protein M0811_12528 [Anaeramoeba ignava]|uniref:PSI domain-containing protein n=1 Tax=Anaeramoeba ignava TaxID=1746090 RepID=A0A9Q0L8B2_ANAIG|nr:hypothetical protein M0811_12528 [Anaeramoeba ignava]